MDEKDRYGMDEGIHMDAAERGTFRCKAPSAGDTMEEMEALEAAELKERGIGLICTYLEKRGYTILERGWCCDEGVADIVAADDGCTVMIDASCVIEPDAALAVPPLEVDAPSYWHYRRMALLYLADHEVPSIRLDLVSVALMEPRHARIRHLVGLYAWEDDADNLALYQKRRHDDAGRER